MKSINDPYDKEAMALFFKEITKGILSAIIIIIALVAIFATPKIADIGIIIGAVLLISTQFAPIFTNNKILKIILSIFAMLIQIVSIIISLSFSSVDVGHTGFLVTFGKVSDQTYGEGFHLKPFYSTMVQIDNRIQKNGHDDKAIPLTAFTKDTQQVFINYTVNYKVNRENAGKLYKEIGLNFFQTVLIPIIQESVKIECAKYTADSLLENRDKLAKDIEQDIKIKFKQSYIDLTATAIEDLGFSDEYEKAVEQKQVAMQDKLKAEQEAEKLKIQVDAEAYKKITDAKAEAEANELKQKSITDNLLEYEKIKKWNGSLPQVQGSASPIIDMRK